MSFDKLKKSSKTYDSLLDQLESMQKKSYNNDQGKYWKPTRDTAGNGSAIIRFLTGDDESDTDPSIVKFWEHGFKGPTGQWYFEKSLTTLGLPDPVTESNSLLWNTGIEENKKIVQSRKRKLVYVSNILVIRDPAKPENEGKVFMFKYGQKIMDKIKKLMKPEFDEDERINPFDLWKGVNFRLRVKTVANFPNYDDSDFDRRTTPVSETDEEIEKIWNQRHNLYELVDPKSFKTYEELKARFETVTNSGNSSQNKSSALDFADDEEMPSQQNTTGKFDFSKLDEEDEPQPSIASKIQSFDDEDDDEKFFQSLTNR